MTLQFPQLNHSFLSTSLIRQIQLRRLVLIHFELFEFSKVVISRFINLNANEKLASFVDGKNIFVWPEQPSLVHALCEDIWCGIPHDFWAFFLPSNLDNRIEKQWVRLVYSMNGPNPASFLFIFVLFNHKFYSKRQRDSNSDFRIRRCARWPLDLRGPWIGS